MSLFDVVAERFESPVRGSKSPKRSESTLKGLKEPRPTGSKLRVLDTSDEKLKEALEDDWDEVSNDPAQLEVARRWVTEAKQVANGIIPERYTQTSDCKYCGPVMVVEGYPLQANNCPWCMNRIKGLPIPTIEIWTKQQRVVFNKRREELGQ